MSSGLDLPARITFGRFCLMPHRRELLSGGEPIRLGTRAFEVLIALIEARGSIVSKDALMARVWPGQVVEENNLEVQISTLRTVLGAERTLIRTVFRRGYVFTGELGFPADNTESHADTDAASERPRRGVPATNLPQPVSGLIGRDDSLHEVLRLAATHRLVTLAGTGGIGKTRLALAASHQLLPRFRDGVWLAELAPLSDPGLVPVVVAAAAGLKFVDGAVTAERVANAVKRKELLLLLDNCEHLIDAAAMMAEALLRANQSVRIIATSREPLRAEGEQVYPVPPLDVPAADIDERTDPLGYGAVRLFVERARAADPQFARDGRLAPTLGAICRRLDGIPLAIELAAVRAAALGIEDLAVRLDACFDLLTSGRRTAPPRHQTLRATLDWSFGLLAEPERVQLRRLAIFVGPFSLQAASAIVEGPDSTGSDVLERCSSLVAKSLVVSEAETGIARYRLLDTTRAYAIDKLDESGEREHVARRHAEYYRELFEWAGAERKPRTTAEWLGAYGWHVDNLRAALDWAFSAVGDAWLGVALTAAAVPLWMHLSLVDECRLRVGRAFASLETDADRSPHLEMRLHAAIGEVLTYTRGATPEYEAAWTKALELAERLEDAEYQLRALWGLWSFRLTTGGHRIALELAQRFRTVAKNGPDPYDPLFGEQMVGAALHHLGDQTGARRHLEVVPARHGVLDHRAGTVRFQVDFRRFQADFRISARAFLARVLWFQGFPDQAVRMAELAVAMSQNTGHALSLSLALSLAACPVALLVGDLDMAEHYVQMLVEHSKRHALALWSAYSRCYMGALVIKRGDIDAGMGMVRAGFAELGGAQSAVLRLARLLAAEALGQSGRIDDALTAIEELIDHSTRTEERWLIAELLRVKGELVLARSAYGASGVAADHFRQALAWARRQGALAWELRAATSLARLLRDQKRPGDALACLRPVYDRFSEGFDTTDLQSARVLLDSLQ